MMPEPLLRLWSRGFPSFSPRVGGNKLTVTEGDAGNVREAQERSAAVKPPHCIRCSREGFLPTVAVQGRTDVSILVNGVLKIKRLSALQRDVGR